MKPAVFFILIAFPLLVIGQHNTKKTYEPTGKQRLDSVLMAATPDKLPLSYFTALYNTMIGEIQTANTQGHFTDTQLIDYIQRNFTSYYLNALGAHAIGDSIPYAWKAALDTGVCKNCSFSQWLSLGTNAHINHDLYFILLTYFKKHGTTSHNDKKARKEFFIISARETGRMVKLFIKTDPKINWAEGVVLKTGQNGVKLQMKQYLRKTWHNAMKAANNPEKEAEITQQQLAFANKNAKRFLHLRFPVKVGFNMMKSLDELPFETKIGMLGPALPTK